MVVVAERFGDDRVRQFEDVLMQCADPARPGWNAEGVDQVAEGPGVS